MLCVYILKIVFSPSPNRVVVVEVLIKICSSPFKKIILFHCNVEVRLCGEVKGQENYCISCVNRKKKFKHTKRKCG